MPDTKNQQLTYPLDKRSLDVLSESSDSFLYTKIFNLLWKNTFHYQTFFETLDGFTTSGSPTLSGSTISFTTGSTSGNSSGVSKTPVVQSIATFRQPSNFRTSFNLSQITNQTIYFVVGAVAGPCYGFKVVNGTIYGVTNDGTTENTQLLFTISASTEYDIEARYTPSTSVAFYINGAQRGNIGNVNLPPTIPVSSQSLFEIKITTNANAAKTMIMSFFEYLQTISVQY